MTATATAPVRATWKAHGNPQNFRYYGNGSAPDELGVEVGVETARGSLTFRTDDGEAVAKIGGSAKFWATPTVAELRAADEPKAKREPKPEPQPCTATAEDGRVCNRTVHGDELAHRFPRVLSAETAEARSTLLAELEAAAVGDLALPEGYVLHYAYPAGHSRLSNAAGGEPKWLARCDVHGTTHAVTPDTGKAAKAAGFAKNRRAWCKPCDRQAKADERQAAKDAEAKAAKAAERAAAKAAKAAAADATAEHDSADASS